MRPKSSWQLLGMPTTVLLLTLLALPGCSDGEAPAPQPDSALQAPELARNARKAMLRIEALLRQAWLPEGRIRHLLQIRRDELDTFVQAAARLQQDPADEASVMAQGRTALKNVGGNFHEGCDILLAASAVLVQCSKFKLEIVANLEGFKVPPSQVFALRNRYRDGWLPEYDMWMRDLFKGVNEVIQHGQSQRAPLAARNLERSAVSGAALLRTLQLGFRKLSSADTRLATRLPRLVAYAESVVARGRSALAAGSPPAVVTKERLEQIEEARVELESQLPKMREEWKKLREELVAGRSGAEDAYVAFEKRLGDLHRNLLSLSRRFGNAVAPARSACSTMRNRCPSGVTSWFAQWVMCP